MLPYLQGDHAPTRYYGVEPDPGMRRQSEAKLAETAFDGEILAGKAERLPFATGSIDAVIVSCVFCSVPETETAIEEISRVLDSSGEFRFFEHVRSSGIVGRSQDYLTPVWRRFGGNCHLNREFLPEIENHASVELSEAGYYTSGHYPIRKFVRGCAVPSK
jgi:ubiquinone/menaquinone biosynthesis C-methylase UbiE